VTIENRKTKPPGSSASQDADQTHIAFRTNPEMTVGGCHGPLQLGQARQVYQHREIPAR
jgi:hypothetical protein